MKKWFCAILVLILLLPGCAKEEPLENPVRFYYLAEEISYFGSGGAIGSELREGGNWLGGYLVDDYMSLLNQYLLGPEDQKLARTFPQGTAVRDMKYFGDVVTVVLSKEFAQLTGIDLSLACACLTLTACELTGAKSAEISAENGLLDGSEAITMVYDQLVLEDLCRVPVDPN